MACVPVAAQASLTAAQADLNARRVDLENQLLDLESRIAATEADHEATLLRAEAEGEMNRRGIVSTLQFKQTEPSVCQFGTRLRIERERAAKFRQNINAQLAAEGARISQLENTASLRHRHADALRVRAGIAGVPPRMSVVVGAPLASRARATQTLSAAEVFAATRSRRRTAG